VLLVVTEGLMISISRYCNLLGVGAWLNIAGLWKTCAVLLQGCRPTSRSNHNIEIILRRIVVIVGNNKLIQLVLFCFPPFNYIFDFSSSCVLIIGVLRQLPRNWNKIPFFDELYILTLIDLICISCKNFKFLVHDVKRERGCTPLLLPRSQINIRQLLLWI
jgi:hypothetical protein